MSRTCLYFPDTMSHHTLNGTNWVTVCKTVCHTLSDRCLSCLSLLSVTLVYFGQTVGRIQMKLGTQVGLGPGHIVLDGDPAPLPKGTQPPIFGSYLLWPNGWIDATWYGGRPRSRRLCVRWVPSSPVHKKAAEPLPNFWPKSIVAKRLDGPRWHLAWRWALL